MAALAEASHDDLDYLDGVRESTREGLGRVLEATRDFEQGETVLTEAPLLAWGGEDKDGAEMERLYDALSEDQKARLLNLYHIRDGEQPRIPACRARLAQLRAGGRSGALWSLALFSSMACDVAATTDGAPRRAFYAFYSVGCLAAHACAPTCVRQCEAVRGRLNLVAARPIRAGELVTFSYCRSDASTLERRSQLARTKDFVCTCARCAGPDVTATLPCVTDGCGGVLAPTYTPDPIYSGETEWTGPGVPPPPPANDLLRHTAAWRCGVCGTQPPADDERVVRRLAEAAAVEADIREVTAEIKRTGLKQEHEATLDELVARTRRCTGPVHQALQSVLWTLWNAHIALAAAFEDAASRTPSAAKPLRRQACTQLQRHADTCAQLVQWQECAAAGCARGCEGGGRANGCSSASHAPAVKAVSYLKVDFQELRKQGGSARAAAWVARPPLAPLYARYLPLLAATYGAADDDLLEVCAVLRSVPPVLSQRPPQCAGCPWVGRGFSLCARCGRVAYCGRECQVRHWKARHKAACAVLAEVQAAAKAEGGGQQEGAQR